MFDLTGKVAVRHRRLTRDRRAIATARAAQGERRVAAARGDHATAVAAELTCKDAAQKP